MVDDNQKEKENQQTPSKEEPKTIFETVPVHEKAEPSATPISSLKPEEIAADVESPTQVSSPPVSPPPEPPMYIESDNRRKYLLIGGGVLIFFILFIVLLSAIFGSSKSQSSIHLTYWGLWEDPSTMQTVIQTYQQQHKNITISYEKLDPQDYRKKLVARTKNNQNPPDIFRFHNTWLPEIRDVASSLPKSIMSNEEYEKTFYPVTKQDLKVGDSYYGIPLMIDGLVLVYNDSLFKKAGIDNPPVTWDDILNYVGKLTVKDSAGQVITSGMALGSSANIDHFSDIFGLFLIQNGGTITSLDSREAAGALESYRKFAEPPDNVWDASLPNSVSAFTQEKVAMIIVPSWEILTIKTANPEISMKVIPVPSIPGSKSISIASYWVEGVSKTSKNQLEAWRFLAYLSQKDTMTKLYETERKSRLFGEPYSRVDLGSLLAQNEYIGAVIKQGNSFVSIPTISRTFDDGLNDSIIGYLKNAINATEQGTAYGDAMKTAKQGTDQVFSIFGIQQQKNP